MKKNDFRPDEIARMHATTELCIQVCRGMFPGLDTKEISDREINELFTSLASTVLSLGMHMNCLPSVGKVLREFVERIEEDKIRAVRFDHLLFRERFQ